MALGVLDGRKSFGISALMGNCKPIVTDIADAQLASLVTSAERTYGFALCSEAR